jgi:thiamine monophosphate synthase
MAIVDASFADDEEHFVRVVRALRPVLRTRQDIWLQLRVKHLTPPEQDHLISRAAPDGWRAHEPVLLNGDRQLAQQLGLGLHHPEDTAEDADRNLPRRSASVHSAAAAKRAVSAGVGVLLFGPVWDPGSKPGVGRGTGALGAICDAQDAWFLALGGIAPTRVPAAIAAGARGVAMLSHVMRSPEPAALVLRTADQIGSLLTEPDPCWIHTPPRIG